MIDRYDWAGGTEAMMRFGPADGPVVVAALPLFEEANRTRAFVVTILRLLGRQGVACALPDLPGTGESSTSLEEVSLAQMRAAYQSAVDSFEGRHCYALGVRSGALLTDVSGIFGSWLLSPQLGSDLIRELGRIGGLSKDPAWWCMTDMVEIAGNRISGGLLNPLMDAKPADNPLGRPLRVVRYETDPRPADLKLSGSPLWRRAEPDNDIELAQILADDIAEWVRT